MFSTIYFILTLSPGINSDITLSLPTLTASTKLAFKSSSTVIIGGGSGIFPPPGGVVGIVGGLLSSLGIS